MTHIFQSTHGDVAIINEADIISFRMTERGISCGLIDERMNRKREELFDKYESVGLALHGDISRQWDGPRTIA